MKKTKNKQRFSITSNGPMPPEVALVAPPKLVKLDLGSGPNPREGFEGVDRLPFDGKVRHIVNLVEPVYAPIPPGFEWMEGVFQRKVLRLKPWPWADCSVEEAHSSHFMEHLTNFSNLWEHIHFFNELYRVLIPGGKATLVFPHWCSNRHYGDPTHKEPFGEMGFYYLLRLWRLGDPAKGVPGNAPHDDISLNPNGYSCNFQATWGYSLHPALVTRSQDVQQDWLQWRKEAAQDCIATLTKE